jgi:hypothetical protein
MDKLIKFATYLTSKNFVSVHSFTLYATIWMTGHAFFWAGTFAMATDKTGVEVALIIGAVTAPITYLQTAVFSTYSKSRNSNET